MKNKIEGTDRKANRGKKRGMVHATRRAAKTAEMTRSGSSFRAAPIGYIGSQHTEYHLSLLSCPSRHCSDQPVASHGDVCFYVCTSPPTTESDTLTTGLSTTSVSRAITKFKMPAMSPTMTEGGIASWKKREGDSFTAGDVLLEIVCHEHQRIARGTTPMTSPRPYRKRIRQLLT
jgi:hypothetical protein